MNKITKQDAKTLALALKIKLDEILELESEIKEIADLLYKVSYLKRAELHLKDCGVEIQLGIEELEERAKDG